MENGKVSGHCVDLAGTHSDANTDWKPVLERMLTKISTADQSNSEKELLESKVNLAYEAFLRMEALLGQLRKFSHPDEWCEHLTPLFLREMSDTIDLGLKWVDPD